MIDIDNCYLQYRRLEDTVIIDEYKKWCQNIVALENSPVINNAVNELTMGIDGMIGLTSVLNKEDKGRSFILIGTIDGVKAIQNEISEEEKKALGEEGFLIKAIEKHDINSIIVTGKSERGVLHGVFCLLRLMQTQTSIDDIRKIENPHNPLRLINQWDNMDGSIERGYAGNSIFYSNNKITENLGRIKAYARLLSSVGINGITINNVNVHRVETRLITDVYLPTVAKIAEIFRGYGIKTFLSINYASPMELDGLPTADPLDEEVCSWWRAKAKEIYSYIPDFGGFLVKADSEFRPGPFTYNRNHAEGANMLAKALKPFGGIVIWRCFVYNCQQDWRDRTTDRARAAYDNFMPLDGEFDDNVILQIKNGPMDFQVREPVSPLFGGLRKTNQTLELQITQEYTGQQKHLCYLVPMWKEVLKFDTYACGCDSTVKKITSGALFQNKYSGIAAVSNIGDDSNWTGFQLAQSNLYGYGRLTWNPDLSSEEITEEWVRMTFSNDRIVVDTISKMLLKSWGAYENYTSPLGIGWMVNPNHHYGPNVDGYEYSKWGTYHRADNKGIGVDRTVKSGTGYVGQYHKEVAEKYEDMELCPEELLLFFHHVSYNYKLKAGKTLIQYIYDTHFEGVEDTIKLRDQWVNLKDYIDEDSFIHVIERFDGQIRDAMEWRDVVNSYFYRKTGIEDELGRKIY